MADLAKFDALQDEKKFDEVFNAVTAAVEADSNNAELLWRLSRANFDKAQELQQNDKAREPFIHTGREWAEKAVAADDGNWAAHKWMAICLSSEGDYIAKKQKIENAFKVKEHADKAHELNPEDATTLHFLGRFAFTIAGISWMERKLAAALMATPPEATYDEALDFFLRAEEKRQFMLNRLWIAKTYLALKNKPKAKEWFTIVSTTEPTCESDNNDIKEANTALKKL